MAVGPVLVETPAVSEPPQTVLTLLLPGPVTLHDVTVQGGLGDELHLTLAAFEPTVGLAEGGVELVVQQVHVVLVAALQMLLKVLFPHKPHMAQPTSVGNTGVFLLEMSAVPGHSNCLETYLAFSLLLLHFGWV